MKKRKPRPPTTRLPATIEEAEALAFARDMIRRLHEQAGDVGSPFQGAESREFMTKWYRAILMTAEGRMFIVEAARVGDQFSREVLRGLILEAKSRGQYEQLPLEVRNYDMELTRGDRPPGPQGPDPRNEFARNVCIAMTVSAVIGRFGRKPTGRSVRQRSACAIVAQALDVIHQGMSYDAVESIWRRYGHSMPTTPDWGALWASPNSASA